MPFGDLRIFLNQSDLTSTTAYVSDSFQKSFNNLLARVRKISIRCTARTQTGCSWKEINVCLYVFVNQVRALNAGFSCLARRE